MNNYEITEELCPNCRRTVKIFKRREHYDLIRKFYDPWHPCHVHGKSVHPVDGKFVTLVTTIL